MSPEWKTGSRCVRGASSEMKTNRKCGVSVHLYSTGAAVESRGRPRDPAGTVDLNVDVQGHVKHAVVTANKENLPLSRPTIRKNYL